MSDININFINKSSDTNNSNIVIFQKPTTPDYGLQTIAWMVIKNTGKGQHHPFPYSFDYYISAGNTQMQLLAQHKTLYQVANNDGHVIMEAKPDEGDSDKGYTFTNELAFEIVSADLYNSGSLISSMEHVAPQEKITFETQPNELCLAAVKFDINAGDALPDDFVQNGDNHTVINVENADNKAIVYTTDENGNAVFNLEEMPKEEKTATA